MAWGVEINGFRELSRILKAAGDGTADALKAGLKRAVEPVAGRARARASWSSRIPGTVRTFATTTSAGVRAGGRRAPHARPLEGVGGKSSFRHPVFGNRNVWVTQPTRPFLAPAAEESADEIERAVELELDDMFGNVGFDD